MPRILQRLDCKVLIILLGVASTFIALSYFVLNHVVLPAFEALEEQDAGEDLERVRRAIATELTYLGNIASDWAYWDHTYEYLEGRRDTYEAENLVDST